MLSLLNPLALWLGALLAVPLIIHFLGRQRLRKEPFPSLLLLEEKFARSMQRHRLKNLLLLLIRTMLILCLLLALANPTLETRSAARPGAETMAALVHNGVYGLLPAPADAVGADQRASALERQRRRIKALDSATGGPVRAVNLIAEGLGWSESAARFGNPAEAVERLLAALDPQASTAQVYLPAFAWEDLAPARDLLAQALQERPGLQVVIWDFGDEGSRLSAFTEVRAVPSTRNPTVTLRARLHPEASGDRGARLRTWLDGRVFQETTPSETGPEDIGRAEVALPLSEGVRTAGRVAFDGRRAFAVSDWHFCFPNPGRRTLAHAGSALASLPSLGRENYHRRILHVAAARDLPWQDRDQLRLIYLSNERNTDAAAYGRIVEFVKRGGRLIVGVGRESDIPMLNRFLLQPLRLGRLGAVTEVMSQGRAEPDAAALARLGGLPDRPGPLGLVRRRFAFAPDSGTAILIRQGGEPVLAEREFQAGRVLLWTTDLDDLDWSDLGVAPLVPLLHRAFLEGAGGLAGNRAVDSDSLLTLEMPDAGNRAEVRDPDGRPFTRARADGNRLRLGPFDKLGLHRVAFGADTTVFAVNLAARGPSPLEEAGWKEWNAAGKAEFLSAFEPFKGRVLVASPGDGDPARASVRPLWRAFLLAAVLLLFLEGLIAAAYAMGKPDGRRAD